MTGELVGPLPTITFFPRGADEPHRIAYTVPKTCDLRAAACTDHHPACDCREADLREAITEYREEFRLAQDVAQEVLRGHLYVRPGLGRRPRLEPGCLCSGCTIARRTFLLGPGAVDYRTGHVR